MPSPRPGATARSGAPAPARPPPDRAIPRATAPRGNGRRRRARAPSCYPAAASATAGPAALGSGTGSGSAHSNLTYGASVADSSLRFYLAIGRAAHDLSKRGRAEAAAGLVTRRWPSWRGRAVEPVIREALSLAVADLPWPEAAAVGGWWKVQPGRRRPGLPGSALFGRAAEVALLDQLVARIPELDLLIRGPGHDW